MIDPEQTMGATLGTIYRITYRSAGGSRGQRKPLMHNEVAAAIDELRASGATQLRLYVKFSTPWTRVDLHAHR